METQSILYRTVALFGATFVAVAMTFTIVIWWILRRGAREQSGAKTNAPAVRDERVG